MLRGAKACFIFTVVAAGLGYAADPYDSALAQLGLRGPVDVKEAGIIPDGGTISIVLTGAEGIEVKLCLDFAMKSATQGQFYVGAAHPTSAGARNVKPGSETERSIVLVLQHWFDSRYAAKKQKLLRERATIVGLLAEDEKGARVVDCVAWCVAWVEKRREREKAP